jgi:hypothetical protein
MTDRRQSTNQPTYCLVSFQVISNLPQHGMSIFSLGIGNHLTGTKAKARTIDCTIMMEEVKKDRKVRKGKKEKTNDRIKHSTVAEDTEAPHSSLIATDNLGFEKDPQKNRKRQRDTDDHEEQELNGEAYNDDKLKDSEDKAGRKEARKRRKEEKAQLLAQVPQVDEDGIAYTRLQIRRMVKRVKKGKPPLPTKEEKQLLLRQERELRQEEEAELAGMFYPKDDIHKGSTSGKGRGQPDDLNNNDDDSSANENDGSDENDMNEDEGQTREDVENNAKVVCHTREKKVRRSKPVPNDYVCQACQNKHKPAHWIYDCTDKVFVKGANQKSKKFRGLHDPDSKKVFVSGLPFDVKPKDVEKLFSACGAVKACKLLKFDDTGRCKGQAYVSFATEESANDAIRLSGTTIDNNSQDDDKKNDKKQNDGKSSPSKRAKLTLKVSRVLNRRSTSKSAKLL